MRPDSSAAAPRASGRRGSSAAVAMIHMANDAATLTARLVLVLAACTFAVPLHVDAKPANKVSRIGFLLAGFPGTVAPGSLEAFREGLRDLGWVEGQNFVIDFRYAQGRSDRLPELAAELVRLKVDVIAAGGGAAAVAAKNATGTIPIVMIAAGDPVGLGLVASLSRPGGNVTGLAWDVGLETFAKSLELLKETVPGIRRVAVLSNPANPGQALAINNLRAAVSSLRLQVRFPEAREPSQLVSAFASIVKERAEAIFIIADPMFISQRIRLAELATKNQLPSMSGNREFVEAGGLMAYGPSLIAAFQRAAVVTDKILKGTKPAELPVEQPTKFDLIINLKTARVLGLTIPKSVLARADRIIE